MNNKKRRIHWWEDAYGRHTCHLNQAGLSFKQSLLGEVYSRGGQWYYIDRTVDSPLESGPISSVWEARRKLRDVLDAGDVWDE